jgi:hypothetical protein
MMIEASGSSQFVTKDDFREYKESSISARRETDERVGELAGSVGELRVSVSRVSDYNRRHDELESRVRVLERDASGLASEIRTELRVWGAVLCIALPILLHFWK